MGRCISWERTITLSKKSQAARFGYAPPNKRLQRTGISAPLIDSLPLPDLSLGR